MKQDHTIRKLRERAAGWVRRAELQKSRGDQPAAELADTMAEFLGKEALRLRLGLPHHES